MTRTAVHEEEEEGTGVFNVTCLEEHTVNCATWPAASRNPNWTPIGH